MKSKRRHELQTNELADRLGVWIEQLRPHLTLILIVVAGFVAIVAAWYYLAASREYEQAQAWRSYMDAGADPQSNAVSELSAVADRYSDTLAGLWAAQTAADLEMASGIRLLFQDRAKAETSLSEAEKSYRAILENELADRSPMLLRRARLGLAETLEATGQLEEARKHYQAVVDTDKSSAIGQLAQQRLTHLNEKETKEWYNWFSRQKPVPRKVEGADGATGGTVLPERNLDLLPESPGDDFMSGSSSGEGAPPSAAPSGEGETETAPQTEAKPEGAQPQSPGGNAPSSEAAPAQPQLDAPAAPESPEPAGK